MKNNKNYTGYVAALLHDTKQCVLYLHFVWQFWVRGEGDLEANFRPVTQNTIIH